MKSFKEYFDESLKDWFGKGPKGDWVRMDTKGKIKGPCAREEGEGKPKCLPRSKAQSMSKKDRASAARRKRREDPVADRSGKGGKPIMVKTKKEEVDKTILKKRKKANDEAQKSLKDPSHNPPWASSKSSASSFQREDVKYIMEKAKPTKPALWSRAKAAARAKFDVYPSAYANGWAVRWYKKRGGGWKTIKEEKDSRLKSAGVSGFNKPKRTPSHPKKSHVVVAKSGGKVKTIRFGEQGASTAGKPKAGESARMKAKRKSFKARHGKNIAKGKMSAAYWADKVKW